MGMLAHVMQPRTNIHTLTTNCRYRFSFMAMKFTFRRVLCVCGFYDETKARMNQKKKRTMQKADERDTSRRQKCALMMVLVAAAYVVTIHHCSKQMRYE